MHTLFSSATLNATPWPRRWLWLGVTALAIAGLFAVVLAFARTPQLKKLNEAFFEAFFSVSLVIHVDLSVLVWSLAIGGLLMSYLAATRPVSLPYFQGGAFWCAAIATALMALSIFDTHWEVIKSNYIPVLDNVEFLTGLAFLLASMVVLVIPVLIQKPSGGTDARATLERAIYYGAWSLAIGLAAFILTAELMPSGLPRPYYFEMLFWAGGHVLQFVYTQSAMIGWLVLVAALGAAPAGKGRMLLEWAFPISLLAALLCLPPFFLYAVDSPQFREFYTLSMIHAGGIAPCMVGGYVVYKLVKAGRPLRESRAYYAVLVMSLLLFASGGVIGHLIQGQNVTIPAHYHGSIVGVTLALMGIVYVLLPQFGYRNIASTRLAMWQSILYGVGQIIHISGLAISGGYGVLRKSTGELSGEAKFYMGIMGGGGMLAIIGGLLFVIVVVRAVRQSPRNLA